MASKFGIGDRVRVVKPSLLCVTFGKNKETVTHYTNHDAVGKVALVNNTSYHPDIGHQYSLLWSKKCSYKTAWYSESELEMVKPNPNVHP